MTALFRSCLKMVADDFSHTPPAAELAIINGRVWTGNKSQPSGAYAEFAEKNKGTLEAGKLADVVVLSQDIFRINPDQIQKASVVYTIAGGRVVYGK